MGELREKMRCDLLVANYRPGTVSRYVRCASDFAAHYWRSPAEMGRDEVQGFLHYLSVERGCGPARVKMYVAGLKQVAAREVEQEVLRRLQAPGSIRDLSPNACRFLENVVSLWPSLPRGELNPWVRTFVWAATWNPDTRKVDIVFDEIGLENAIAENPELLKPLPDKVLRKSRGRKGSPSKGSTRK